ncbi:signal peptide peptidase SppA [Auraticoccus sp. F435]|uniref:Signal peptide peptidase SppA n=1 Tax=Auraticoccus cholistanensis TaxID=2656650 RepID=A0A6A9V0Y1_9ACTN|nr:signal peptide peptidase SppA [Auraticoccus cholistanensis]MVA76449.1 signal peptide peptidase SppA [Auraticoccus cholistanensis]
MDLARDLTSRLHRRSTAPTVLELDLSRGVLSAPPRSPAVVLRAMHMPTMRAIRDGLRSGARDPKVAGLVVHVGDCPLTASQVDEVGAMIAEFGAAKPTLAHTETFGELANGLLGYRLGAHAQQVWLQPTGGIGLSGVSLQVTLLRGTLDKVGVEPEFGQRHEYKTAANQFTAREVTEAQREMMQRLADSVLEQTVAVVAEKRGLTEDEVRRAVDDTPLSAAVALERRLVDHLGYRDEVYSWLRESWGSPVDGKPEVDLHYVHRYEREHGGPALVKNLRDKHRPSVALVGVQGPIATGASSNGGLNGPSAGSDTVTAHLRAAAADEHVRAVVLRVDSPGGSYVASDAIRREVRQLVEGGRPVVASMGDLAASGGYFVSMGASEVVANPSTLTGSIGVLAGKMVTAGLTDKLGLVRAEMTAGARADMFSTLRGFDESDWAVLDAWLDDVYADFTAKAAADRGMDLAALEPLARGRVWTGADAAERGLVDHLGGVSLALERACELAGLDRDAVGVRAVPGMPLLAQLRPARSSESTGQNGADAHVGVASLLAGGPEATLTRLAGLVGLQVPGVLALPWRLTLG